MADKKRESARVKDPNQRKVLDEAARKHRLQKSLQALEQDNYHDDPHANLEMDTNAPKKKLLKRYFEVPVEYKINKGLKTYPFKKRFRRNFAALVEEDKEWRLHYNKDDITYSTAKVPPSRYPPRHFCAVCGFPSNQTCVQCGARYCCIKCFGVHKATRCLMWTA